MKGKKFSLHISYFSRKFDLKEKKTRKTECAHINRIHCIDIHKRLLLEFISLPLIHQPVNRTVPLNYS
jgi:hypothetical protein